MAIGADDAALITAGIQAAGAVGSTLAGSIKKRGSTRMMNVSKELAKYNTELSEDLYKRYQSPAAQVQQYREAGLNPNLLAGGAASGAPQAGAVDTDASKYGMSSKENAFALSSQAIQGALTSFQGYLMNEAKISNDVASAEALRAQTTLNELKSRGQELDNEFSAARNQMTLDSLNMDNSIKAVDVMIKQRYGLIEAKAKYEQLLENTDLTRSQRSKVKKEIDHLDQQIAESQARVRNMQDQIALGYGNLNLGYSRLEFDKERENNRVLESSRDFNFRQKEFRAKRRMDLANLGLKMTLRNDAVANNAWNQAFQLDKWNQKRLDDQANAVNPIGLLKYIH